MKTSPLPIIQVLDQLGEALAGSSCAVLQAPPGAGKTTLVPLALLDAPWLKQCKILMLAPRRLAARAAAGRMARILGERVGQRVGFRIRMESRVGPATRIEVITEGVLTRMLQSDPSLEGVGLVIFDEFHERSLAADLAMALCLDVQGVLNTDIKLLVMSATMATEPVADLLDNAPVIMAEGRSYPIETRYAGAHTPSGDLAEVARTVVSALRHEAGGILVFLPGAAEIRQVARQLEQADLGKEVVVAPLLGNLTGAEQDRAISPPPAGIRKIVLATAIAETSLTIEGIGVVVDCGLQRISKFDARSGMSRLVTLPVSRASADQRRGRAGRLGPGVCLRLWSEAINNTLAADRPPEIMEADLSGLALELAGWGVRGPDALKWLDPPPKSAYVAAVELLQALNALNRDHQLTPHGREMITLGVHPRLSHMLLMARKKGWARAACDLTALLTERDPLRFDAGHYEVDLQLRYDLLQAHRKKRSYPLPGAKVNRGACHHLVKMADQLRHRLGWKNKNRQTTRPPLGQLLAWAYPDRIARRRPGDRGRYLMTGGQGVRLDVRDPMSGEDYLVVAQTDGQRNDARIFRAATYDRTQLEAQFSHQLNWQAEIRWDSRHQAVEARQALRIGALTLQTRPQDPPDQQQVMSAMIQGIAQNGIEVLPWNKFLRTWQSRVCFLHRILPRDERWPDLSDERLTTGLNQWLPPYLSGVTRLRDLSRMDLKGALFSLLAYDAHQQLDTLAPTHWTVPSGSRIPIDYGGRIPVLAVRLQEMFGLGQTPAIAGGRQPLLIHLLSPAHRPVQVTQDLAGFWQSSYHQVKKELKGRYPKHFWPDDPLRAQATARAKSRKNSNSR